MTGPEPEPRTGQPARRPPMVDEPEPPAPGRTAAPCVYRFIGGPLDGRVQTRPPSEPAPTTIRHAHLHDGPQIVHLYDLYEVGGGGGEYRVRVR